MKRSFLFAIVRFLTPESWTLLARLRVAAMLSISIRLSRSQAKRVLELAFALLAVVASYKAHAGPPLEELYSQAAEAQDRGRYGDWIQDLSLQPGLRPLILEGLTREFERVRELPAPERLLELRSVYEYYSQSGQVFRTAAPQLLRRSGLSLDELAQNLVPASEAARRTLDALLEYERQVTLPILEQVEFDLGRTFPRSNILFIGRDMTIGEVWSGHHGPLAHSNVMSANISRRVRDAALGGRMAELRQLLAQVGLTRERFLAHGAVFVDSSMGGKIPRAILLALTEGMSPEETFQGLTRSHIRYLVSNRETGPGIHERALRYRVTGRISPEQRLAILDERAGIPVFPLELPAETGPRDGLRPHNWLEHRPKVLASPTDLRREGPLVRTSAPLGESPAARIQSLLGLAGDSEVALASRRRSELFTEISNVAAQGRDALTRWQDAVPPEMAATLSALRVRPTGDAALPFELIVDGTPVTRMSRIVGEGNNMTAYETARGTVIKIVRKASGLRKTILAAWAQPLMDRAGIEVARILSTDPHGRYAEQEQVPGRSLEDLYWNEWRGHVPPEVMSQVRMHRRRAIQLQEETGIWLDFKAANYHLAADGTLLNVDFVPRLNRTHYRYFRNNSGVTLTEDEGLRMFFRYDLESGHSPFLGIDAASVPWIPVLAPNEGPAVAASLPGAPLLTVAAHRSPAPGLELSVGELVRTPGGRELTVISGPDTGRRGRVYRVRPSGGAGNGSEDLALKLAINGDTKTLTSIASESAKREAWHRAGLNHAPILEHSTEGHFTLSRFIEGTRADVWLNEWLAAGMPGGSGTSPEPAQLTRLRALITRSSERGIYIGDLNPKNLIWSGDDWVVIDSGGAREGIAPAEALSRYLDKIPARWARRASSGALGAAGCEGGAQLQQVLRVLLGGS